MAGRPKILESPEYLYTLFEDYKKHCKENPILVQDYVGKDAMMVYREKERPLTDKGFYNYCRKITGHHVKQYFDNQDKLYNEYIAICRAIKDEIDQDQIEGGMAGIYNPSITQRLNNLSENLDVKVNKPHIIIDWSEDGEDKADTKTT
jgi:hypothetical protein